MSASKENLASLRKCTNSSDCFVISTKISCADCFIFQLDGRNITFTLVIYGFVEYRICSSKKDTSIHVFYDILSKPDISSDYTRFSICQGNERNL